MLTNKKLDNLIYIRMYILHFITFRRHKEGSMRAARLKQEPVLMYVTK